MGSSGGLEGRGTRGSSQDGAGRDQVRRGNIKARFPGEFLQDHVTVEQALTGGGSTVRKLLTDNRFVK